MPAMWHCNVNASSLSDSLTQWNPPQMPANRERIASREGASGVETFYMTGGMRINRKNTRGSESVRRFAPGSY
jgi:hypothetical protein